MAESVRVVARFRPSNDWQSKTRADDEPETFDLKFPDEKTVSLAVADKSGRVVPTPFYFDHVFPYSATQDDVYDNVATKTLNDVFEGFNGTILSYGQTGSGKSHTMMGPSGSNLVQLDASGVNTNTLFPQRGILPRIAENLFSKVLHLDDVIEVNVSVSFFEIYRENIKDLLNPENVGLKIRETPAGGIFVQNLVEEFVSDSSELLYYLRQGEVNRSVAATKMNETSSRSHTVFVITVMQKCNDGSTKTGKLNLADLAGSERINLTGAKGTTLEEAKMINKSLSALGNCIAALTDSKRNHIPYRDSTLSFFLKDSLGGNTKTTLIICCSSDAFNVNETVSTLRFGARAKQVKNNARVNRQRGVAELEAIVANMKKEGEANMRFNILLKAFVAEMFGRYCRVRYGVSLKDLHTRKEAGEAGDGEGADLAELEKELARIEELLCASMSGDGVGVGVDSLSDFGRKCVNEALDLLFSTSFGEEHVGGNWIGNWKEGSAAGIDINSQLATSKIPSTDPSRSSHHDLDATLTATLNADPALSASLSSFPAVIDLDKINLDLAPLDNVVTANVVTAMFDTAAMLDTASMFNTIDSSPALDDADDVGFGRTDSEDEGEEEEAGGWGYNSDSETEEDAEAEAAASTPVQTPVPSSPASPTPSLAPPTPLPASTPISTPASTPAKTRVASPEDDDDAVLVSVPEDDVGTVVVDKKSVVFEQMQDDVIVLSKTHDALRHTHLTLLWQHKQVTSDYNNLKMEYMQLRNENTHQKSTISRYQDQSGLHSLKLEQLQMDKTNLESDVKELQDKIADLQRKEQTRLEAEMTKRNNAAAVVAAAAGVDLNRVNSSIANRTQSAPQIAASTPPPSTIAQQLSIIRTAQANNTMPISQGPSNPVISHPPPPPMPVITSSTDTAPTTNMLNEITAIVPADSIEDLKAQVLLLQSHGSLLAGKNIALQTEMDTLTSTWSSYMDLVVDSTALQSAVHCKPRIVKPVRTRHSFFNPPSSTSASVSNIPPTASSVQTPIRPPSLRERRPSFIAAQAQAAAAAAALAQMDGNMDENNDEGEEKSDV